MDKTAFTAECSRRAFAETGDRSPVSVDSHIWPSYFLFFPYIRMIGDGSRGLISAEWQPGLMKSLEDMHRILSANRRVGIQIAVELVAPEGIAVAEFPSPVILSNAEPDALPRGSMLLGYDVADAGFWSGLSNCGYTKEELAQLRPEWCRRINDLGLLRSEEDALAFKDISDKRVPEHAPFWVYRLHRLPEGDAASADSVNT